MFCKPSYKTCIACLAHLGCAISQHDQYCPDPNESPSSPRTSCSPTASRSDSPVEGTAVQLAPVLRPAVGAASEATRGTFTECRACKEELCKGIDLFPMDEAEKTEFITALDKMKRQFAIKHPHINVAQLGYYRFMLMELSRAREMGEQPDYCVRLVDEICPCGEEIEPGKSELHRAGMCEGCLDAV